MGFLLRVALGVALLTASAPALADEYPLTVEFDDGLVDRYGTVLVEEVVDADGFHGLQLDVELDPGVLGPECDLHRLYLNLAANLTGLHVITHDAVPTLYLLLTEPSVAGGAGSSFDYDVHLGNGAGRKGNGRLQRASFSLFADQDVFASDLAPISETAAGIEAQIAVHVQGTALVSDADSETVGGSRAAEDPGSLPPPDEDPGSELPADPDPWLPDSDLIPH
jgi:hypothetical protein